MPKRKMPMKQVIGLDVHSRKLEFSIWDIEKKFSMRKSSPSKTITGEIKDFETIIQKHTIPGAEIVMEASTNAFKLSRVIEKLKRKPVVVKSDTVKNFSPQYKITDKTDAANLARAWLSEMAQTVYIPTEKEQELRDIMHAYSNATRDCTRIANRIWGFCSEHRITLPRNLSTIQAYRILTKSKSELSQIEYMMLSELIEEFKNAKEKEARFAGMISYVVANDYRMQKLLQVLGVGPMIAFAVVAFIGDIKRFENAKKLCAYIGLVPVVNDSGESVGKTHMVSRSGHPLLKSLLIQGAQAGLTYGKLPLYKWAQRLCIRKQNRNIAVVALARKMIMYIWHIMMDHKIIYKEEPQGLRNKINIIGRNVGKERLAMLGCKTIKEFTDNIINCMELEIRSPITQG